MSRLTTLQLGLPEKLLALCEEYHTDPEMVRHGLITDLCAIRTSASDPCPDGLCSHGRDDGKIARAYFERSGYGFGAVRGVSR